MADGDEWRNSGNDPRPDHDDSMLGTVVKIVEFLNSTVHERVGNKDAHLGLGITVLIGGALVSGTLVSMSEYLRATGERWRRVFAQLGTAENPVGPTFDTWADRFAAEPGGNPTHVHLREARVIAPTGHAVPSFDVASEGMLMRLPLARIDGWSFGSAAPSAEYNDDADDLDDR